jgi:hypothetical protein
MRPSRWSTSAGFHGRGIEVMQRYQAFLDIGASAHLLRAADQHAGRSLSDFLEKRLLFGI